MDVAVTPVQAWSASGKQRVKGRTQRRQIIGAGLFGAPNHDLDGAEFGNLYFQMTFPGAQRGKSILFQLVGQGPLSFREGQSTEGDFPAIGDHHGAVVTHRDIHGLFLEAVNADRQTIIGTQDITGRGGQIQTGGKPQIIILKEFLSVNGHRALQHILRNPIFLVFGRVRCFGGFQGFILTAFELIHVQPPGPGHGLQIRFIEALAFGIAQHLFSLGGSQFFHIDVTQVFTQPTLGTQSLGQHRHTADGETNDFKHAESKLQQFPNLGLLFQYHRQTLPKNLDV